MKKLFLLITGLILTIFLLSACTAHEIVAPPLDTPQQLQTEETAQKTDTPPTSTAPAQKTENTSTTQPTQTAENPPPSTESVQITETTTTEPPIQVTENPPEVNPTNNLPTQGEYYYDLTNVVLYIELYGDLPPNYITKAKAKELGWEGGSVEKYKAGAAIGGDRFGNYEGLLPEASGRSYTECDIDTNGYNSRGSRRLVFSNDGLYFYTSDHYESFSEVTVTEDYEVIR